MRDRQRLPLQIALAVTVLGGCTPTTVNQASEEAANVTAPNCGPCGLSTRKHRKRRHEHRS